MRLKHRYYDPISLVSITVPPEIFTYREDSTSNVPGLSWYTNVYEAEGLSSCSDNDFADNLSAVVPPQNVRSPSDLLSVYRTEQQALADASKTVAIVPPPEYAGHPVPACDVEFDSLPDNPHSRLPTVLPNRLFFFTERSANAKRRRLGPIKAEASDTEPEEEPISLAQCVSLFGQRIWAPQDPSQCRFVIADDGFDEAPVDFDVIVDIGDDPNCDEDDDDPSKKLGRAERRRAQLWCNIVKNEMPKEHRKYQLRTIASVNHFKRVSFIAVKEVRNVDRYR